jgi:hypothetical protein
MSKKPPPQPTALISGEVLRRYLDTQDDFALELEVYRHALGFQFKASHAGLYDDAMTNKRRQFDVRASYELPNRVHSIYLTIECKSLDPTYPLLVQRVPRPGNESFHQIMLSRNATTSFGTAREPQPWTGASLFRMSGTHLYDSRQQVGKSMKRVKVVENGFSATDSEIYEKYTQALTSMNEVVQEAALALRSPHAAPGLARAFLPVVVVSDGALWIADYDAGQLVADPRQTDETEFYLGWDYELPNPQAPAHTATFTISHLHIMTRRRLPKFLEEISQAGQIWNQLFGSGWTPPVNDLIEIK